MNQTEKKMKRFFALLFVLPSILLLIISGTLFLTQQKSDPDFLSLKEFLIADIIMILLWLWISAIITFLTILIKKWMIQRKKASLNSEISYLEETKFKDKINSLLLVVFAFTIASFWGALITLGIAIWITEPTGFEFSNLFWVFWLWLPIPILSIILGVIYSQKGFRCLKNIIAGCIVAALLFIYGLFTFLPFSSVNYSELAPYKSFIDADLPSNGKIEIEEWNLYEEDIRNLTVISVYYYRENVEQLHYSIENSKNWMPTSKMKSILKLMLPFYNEPSDDIYISVYNKTTDEYNSLPSASGDYEIYTMIYNETTKTLEIYQFIYTFRK